MTSLLCLSDVIMVCRISAYKDKLGALFQIYMRRKMRFSTMWYVRPAKAQTSLGIRAVQSMPLLVV